MIWLALAGWPIAIVFMVIAYIAGSDAGWW